MEEIVSNIFKLNFKQELDGKAIFYSENQNKPKLDTAVGYLRIFSTTSKFEVKKEQMNVNKIRRSCKVRRRNKLYIHFFFYLNKRGEYYFMYLPICYQ